MHIFRTIFNLSAASYTFNQPYVYRVSIKDNHIAEKRGNGLRKLSVSQLIVHTEGCEGDYNQYRTKHKCSTNDRAVSIMTKKLLDTLTSEGWGPVMPGDLGENITVDGEITFQIGKVYSIGSVLLEITEDIETCNKLQYLPYVGREKRKDFLKALEHRRGWYAKVLSEGVIFPGDKVTEIANHEEGSVNLIAPGDPR